MEEAIKQLGPNSLLRDKSEASSTRMVVGFYIIFEMNKTLGPDWQLLLYLPPLQGFLQYNSQGPWLTTCAERKLEMALQDRGMNTRVVKPLTGHNWSIRNIVKRSFIKLKSHMKKIYMVVDNLFYLWHINVNLWSRKFSQVRAIGSVSSKSVSKWKSLQLLSHFPGGH